MSQFLDRSERILRLLRDFGIVLGVPTLIVIGSQYYDMQLETLREQNSLLKETQFDRVRDLLSAQKELYETEERIQIELVTREMNMLRHEFVTFNRRFSKLQRELFQKLGSQQVSINTRDLEETLAELEELSEGAMQLFDQTESIESQ